MECLLETAVEERSVYAVVNVTRLGNLEQEVGVVCYTESDTARGSDRTARGDTADYISRNRFSPSSEVVFAVNQSTAECRVQLVDDTRLEPRERFYVHLATTAHSFIHIEQLSSMCVYINYAEDDGKLS